MENREAIDQYLRSSLLDFEIQPRITSFDQVMRKLEKKKRRRFIIIFLSGVAIVAGIAGLGRVNFNAGSAAPADIAIVDAPNKKPLPGTTAHSSKNIAAGNDLQKKDPIKSATGKKGSASSHLFAPATVEPPQGLMPQKADGPSGAENNTVVADTSQDAHYELLEPVSMLLTSDTSGIVINDQFKAPATEAISPKKKNMHFFIGLHFSPQASYLHLTENANRNPKYEADGGTFANNYLQSRKEQNKIQLTYSSGLKFGMEINDRWEFMAGVGFQKWRYAESLSLPVPTYNYAMPNGLGATPSKAPAIQSATIMNVYKYYSLSLEAARIWQLRALTVKAGGGMALNYNYSSSGIVAYQASSSALYDQEVSSDIRRMLVTPFLKAGIIEQLGPRLSFQLSPFIYYNPTSTFSKDYVIKQKFMGSGLEIMLLLRL